MTIVPAGIVHIRQVRDPDTVGEGGAEPVRCVQGEAALPFNLAFQHVERVCVIVVDVGINTFPARFKNSVDDLEVGKLSEQPVRSALRLEPLAFVRGCEERFHHADHADITMHAPTPFDARAAQPHSQGQAARRTPCKSARARPGRRRLLGWGG